MNTPKRISMSEQRHQKPWDMRKVVEQFGNNGTPFSDEQWKAWYTNHKSSDEIEQERLDSEGGENSE